MLPLNKAFVLPHFHYCLLMLYGARNRDKLELLNKHIFKFIFNDVNSSDDRLLRKTKTTEHLRTVKEFTNMLIAVFKSLFVSAYPKYLKKLFPLGSSKFCLRRNNVLILPEPRTTSYGLESIK